MSGTFPHRLPAPQSDGSIPPVYEVPSPTMKPKAVYLINQADASDVYGPAEHRDLSAVVDFLVPPLEPHEVLKHTTLTEKADVIFSGWGMPRMDENLLAQFSNLRAIFHAAGSVKSFATDALWARGIRVSSAVEKNAIPVAEFTVSQIIFCLKHGWQRVRDVRATREYSRHDKNMPGAYRSKIGLLSLGHTGRLVAKHLRQILDVDVIAFDPFVSEKEAAELGVRLVNLETVFASADVVSCHTPLLPSTTGMIRSVHFASMRPGATFINTARGKVVNEADLVAVFSERTDLFALLDVTDPEPPQPDSPLYSLNNVVITPHIAGSLGHECRRLGRMMVDEFRRYTNGAPLLGEVIPDHLALKA